VDLRVMARKYLASHHRHCSRQKSACFVPTNLQLAAFRHIMKFCCYLDSSLAAISTPVARLPRNHDVEKQLDRRYCPEPQSGLRLFIVLLF
jgi:hypothetical protein